MLKPLAALAGLAALAFLPAAAAQGMADFQSGDGLGDRVGRDPQNTGRSTVIAPNGAAATAHPLATRAAIDTLRRGGSAVDAAIAANAMLGLVEPVANGMGGDIFVLIWDPETQTLYGLNGSGRSAMGATLEEMQACADEKGGGELPPFGSCPVTVPGAVDGWFMMHDRFGKLPMETVLADAIWYAETGAPVPEVIAYYWAGNMRRLQQAYDDGMLEEFDNAKATYMPGGQAPREGSIFRNPDLAATLRLIATEGRDAFYKGPVAETIDAYMKRIGGPLRYEDFAAHEGEWVEPVCVPYRETKVCGLPPNTQGVATLEILAMLERFDLREMGWGSPEALTAMVEAKRLAFADRARGFADPAFYDSDPTVFLHPDYLAMRSAMIDPDKPMADPYATPLPTEAYPEALASATAMPGAPPRLLLEADAALREGDTTYLAVADSNGMMVSLIQSNYRGMGSGLVPDGLGFMLQDRGQLFSLDPAHPNVWEPGKRPFHTIIPGFAFKKDVPSCAVRAVPIEIACPYEPWLAFGVMGGGMQPQGQAQIITNLIDFGMGLQEAGDAARWEHDGGGEPTDRMDCLEAGETPEACPDKLGTVYLESGYSEETRAALEARGYVVRDGRGGFGGYQAVMRDFETGAWHAATEMRKDGSADGH